MSDTFTLNRGSDLDFTFHWPNPDGSNADLTGYSVTPYDESSVLTGLITLTITDPATGLITGRVEWSDSIPDGRSCRFRVRVSIGQNQKTTSPMWLNIV